MPEPAPAEPATCSWPPPSPTLGALPPNLGLAALLQGDLFWGLLTWGQEAATAAADDLAFAAHVGQLRCLQRPRLSQVDGNFAQAAGSMDLRLERPPGWTG